MDTIKTLFQSRKFLLLLFDFVASVVMYFAGHYSGYIEDVKFLIGAIQPVFLFVIGGIAYEDGKQKAAAPFGDPRK